jgi:norsolorinic acid ketoreductase
LAGIGKELLRKYLSQPSRTVISAVRDISHPTVAEIRRFPVAKDTRHIVVKIDSNIPADAEAAIKELQSQGISKLDTVIANAGIGKFWGKVADTPIDEVYDHFNTNSIGPFALYLATRQLLLASQTPRFVVISTELGSIGFQGQRPIPDVAYGMSKAAVNFFVNKVHHEEKGIVAFPIHPGWVQTPLGDAIAVAIGKEKAAINEEESAQAVYEQVSTSRRQHFAADSRRSRSPLVRTHLATSSTTEGSPSHGSPSHRAYLRAESRSKRSSR